LNLNIGSSKSHCGAIAAKSGRFGRIFGELWNYFGTILGVIKEYLSLYGFM
jgi:hypothetical protein